jgi:hypothetical protein
VEWNAEFETKTTLKQGKKSFFLAFADILCKDDFINIAILQSKW